MATVREIEGSRVGCTRGADATGYNILVRVIPTMDDWADVDGVKVAPDPTGLAAAKYPYGSTHPNNANQRVVSWTEVRCLSSAQPGIWDVRVNYAAEGAGNPPSASSGEWLISVRGASVTRTLVEELPDPNRSLLGQTPRLIGPTIFESVPASHPEALYYVITTGGEIQSLRNTGRTESQPIQVPWPACQVNFTRDQPNFSEWAMAGLTYYKHAVNRLKFRGAAPRHVALSDFIIDPIDKDMPGQIVAGRAWRVTLPFLWSDIPWSPQEKQPQWRDPTNGTMYGVYHSSDDPGGEWKAGDKMVDSFRVNREVNFETLFALLNRAGYGKGGL